MTFKKVLLPATMVLFALCRAAAAATLRSSDDAFSVNVPGKWQVPESTDPRSALLAKKEKAEIKVQSLSRPAPDEALTAKLQATQKKLKKDRGDITIEKYLRSRPPTTERIRYVEDYIGRYLGRSK